MTNKPYQVEGDFQMGRNRQHFSFQVVTKDEAAAREQVYARLGSQHGAERRQVTITSAKPIKAEDVTDAAAKVALKHQK